MAAQLDSAVNALVKECLETLQERGLSQYKIADVVGASQVQVGRLLKGTSGTSYRIAANIAKAAGQHDRFVQLTGGTEATPSDYEDADLSKALSSGDWSESVVNGARSFASAMKPRWSADEWSDLLSTVRRIDRSAAQRRALDEIMSQGIDRAESRRHELERVEAVRQNMRRPPPGTLTAPLVEYTRPRTGTQKR